MVKIKKVLISQILSMVFIFSFLSIGYCVPDFAYNKTSLRVPIAFSGSSEEDRMLGLIVIKKIQEFQINTPGIKSDTIIRKIKKEFDETIYHLQERVRVGDNNNFYLRSNREYFEIINGEIKGTDKATFEKGRRILIKVMRSSYTKEKLILELEKVVADLKEKLKRPPNIREAAEAMPSLKGSRDPAALLYKYFQSHGMDPADYGIGKFSGKANIIIKRKFKFAGTRIFLPPQLDNMIQISAEKTPISNETKIDLVDINNPENRLTIEHIKKQDVLRLTHIQPSGKIVTSDISDIKQKTAVTLTLNPVFSDFYDIIFSIPLDPGKERLRAVAEHLRNRNAIYYEQKEGYINFHGHCYLPSFYSTHPGRIGIYRDRESWVRFLVFEDVANPDNIVGYEWREDRIIPLEGGQELKTGSLESIDNGKIPLYNLSKSTAFREFDQRLDKSIEIKIVTPGDMRLSDVSIGTGRFAFRVKRDVSIISFEGSRSIENKTRDDRARYPIRIVREDDKSEIKIGYKNPDMQGEFVVEGLNREDGVPIVLKGPAGYEDKRGYFNLSTIIEMIRRGLIPGIKASDWLLETFDFYEGAEDPNLRNPIRSYKIEEFESREKFLIEDILVDPTTFFPWHGAKGLFRANKTRTDL